MERSGGSMLLSSEVRRFLFEVYGYGKVRDFVERKKPIGESLRDFFDDTIIGTYRPQAHSRESGDFVHVGWPRVSRIKDSEADLRGDKNRLVFLYHLDNNSFFHDLPGEKVRDFFDLKVRPVLTGARFDYTIRMRRGWEYLIQADNFRLQALGTQRNNATSLLVDMDVSADVVQEVNGIVSRYHATMNSVDSKNKDRDEINLQNVPV